MNYELAKKLKDAGYKLKVKMYRAVKKDNTLMTMGDITGNEKEGEDYIFFPEVHELIEECGDKFEYLNRVNGGSWVAGTKDSPREETLGDSNYVSGKTPEEAVANLWLELNKK